MIKKIFAMACLFLSFTLTVLAQTMTDQQVIDYTKQQMAAGVSEREIATQLLRRGVTMEQVNRIRNKINLENQQNTNGTNNNNQQGNQNTIRRQVNGQESNQNPVRRQGQNNQQNTQIYPNNLPNRGIGNNQINQDNQGLEQDEFYEGDLYYIPTYSLSDSIYGHSLFTNPDLTFEPSLNIATPTNYRLGPGDEVIINIWGASENTIRETISPEGSIQVSGLGPVHLNGMTVRDANAYLQKEFAKIYAGIGGQDPSSQIQLTLGNIRTIQISVVGEATSPGTYMLSAFSSVFHALYRAGGVNEIGSLRDIKVVRNGRTIAHIDVYDILMKGKLTDDIKLQEGDVIKVDAYKSLVKVEGKVRRPMYYEMKDSESLQTLLTYAGGFTGDAYKKSIRIIRKSGG